MSQQLKQRSIQQQQEQKQRQQKSVRSSTGNAEVQMSAIIHEINHDKSISQELPKRISKVEPPTIKNPIYYYNGSQKYDWKLSEIDPFSLIDHFAVQSIQFTEELPFQNDIQLKVVQTQIVSSTFTKHIYYIVERKDKNGQGKFRRRYREYIAFRKKIIELWPVVFIPVLPNKTFIGSSEEQIIRSRTKYLNHFWRKLISYQQIYYSQQVQLFINATQDIDIESTLQKIQIPNIDILLQKYKNIFNEAYQTSIKQQFMYRKQQAPVILQQFQIYFSNKRKDLNQFKDSIKRLTQSKKNYMKSIAKLNLVVLPEYQDVMLKWFNGVPLVQQQIKKAPIRKSTEVEKTVNKEQPQVQKEKEEEKVEEKIQITEYECLYNSEAYKSQLQDLERQLKSFNYSNWLIYDIIKFQLKDLDTALMALDKIKLVRKQIDFLTRNIASNKDQIESLNNKKTTLKIFFMGGSQDDKKAKLTMQNEQFQQNLQKFQQFYLILLALIEKQLITYHKQRIDYYQRAIKKIVVDEIGITKAILQTHLYEVQIFSKISSRKIRQSYQNNNNNQQQQVEIKE